MLAPALAEDNLPPKLFLIHGGPGAQGSLHGLSNSLPVKLRPREILQRYSGDLPLTVDQHITDMAAIIQEPANILGHSWGAMLSLSFASQYPSRCQHIILVGCGTYSTKSRAEYERRINERTNPIRKAELKAAVANANSDTERQAAFRAYAEYATSLQAYSPIVDPYPDALTKFDPDGHAETWRDAIRLQSEDIEPSRFASITCPVTLIQGRQDPHPGELIFQDLKPHLPQLEYIEISDCGHEPWLEKYARHNFLKCIEQLLA
ncbi:MAG: alpha/beta hydrolase [Fimbriimonadaceae bacterium]|nr:MAG: alpha/beta hydrolase [Fimbriimonadaceae bacterium]